MSKHYKNFKQHCFETFAREQVVNRKTVVELLRNSYETLGTQILLILRNFQYRPKFLVSYKEIRVMTENLRTLIFSLKKARKLLNSKINSKYVDELLFKNKINY